MVYLDADTSLRGHKFRGWRCYLFLTQITLANLQTATNNCLELIKAVLESDSEGLDNRSAVDIIVTKSYRLIKTYLNAKG